MKTLKKLILTIAIALFIGGLSAQTPPPPNGDGEGNSQDPTSGGNTPVGGGAPIGSGTLLLLGLGAAYGGKKVWDFHRTEK
ncbi:MAG: hypothetical protein K9I94_04715 [Bacteroidales bacterium]|nr:hypothetical protein [Bacteroidales bacterium]